MGNLFAGSKKKESIHNQSSGQTSPNQNVGRIKPDLTEVIYPEGYIQNAEQNESSIWQKIKKNEQN